ncbi:MAG: YbdD/YjiX family protein [Gemmatimonadaceae bacterium]|jgi:uncharacterized short protein YbdD (DUF466 family)|nr:YbdD/YjiX family protein [Gemmatimonadaceae bacterium]
MRARLLALARLVRTIIGVPDYERYLRHMRARHPGCRIMTRAEFAAARLEARYSRPGSRCC